MSAPFIGQVFTFHQPDGTPITVRGWGDQHHAVFENLEGYTVVRNPVTQYWEVAQLSPDGMHLEPLAGVRSAPAAASAGVPRGQRERVESTRARARESGLRFGLRRCEQRRQERRNLEQAARTLARGGAAMPAPPQRGTVGTYVGLCLLIEFPDVPATIARDEVERFCNQPGYNGFGNQGSVRDYFFDNSLGRCTYTNLVAPYYRAKKPRSYYTDPAIEYTVRARELINEALASLKASGFDFSALTVDAGGYVYATNIYYVGPAVNDWSKGLWPHASQLGSPVPLVAGKRAMDYQFTNMGSELTLGTFCHENGHMLCDYPDLYDYGNESSGVGAYCLMCAGANINPRNPTQISAYLKRASGWAGSVTPLAHGQDLTLNAGANEFALLAKDSKEYFLIEARTRQGRDAALPGAGLAIWHIDEAGNNSFEQMSATRHYEVSLEQADGRFQFEKLAGQMGDVGDLFAGAAARFGDSTTPSSKWWDGTASQLTLEQMSAVGAQIRFRCLIGAPTTTTTTTTARRFEATPDKVIPDNLPAGIIETLQVPQALMIEALTVEIDISHSYPGDLLLTLTPPSGPALVLHSRSGSNVAQGLKLVLDATKLPALATLRGRDAAGAWRLAVQDLAVADIGRLNRWALAFTPAAATTTNGPLLLKESPGQQIPDNRTAGISRSLAANAAATARLGRAEVKLNITHPYIGDLRVSLVSPAGTEVLLHDRTGSGSDNLITTYTATTTPALAALAGQPLAGNWQLRVADLAGSDVGKLNEWALTLVPA